MVRELRKRKAEEPAAPTPAPAKKTKAPSKPKAKAETVAKPEPATKTEPKDEAKTTAKTTAKANDKADGPLTTGDKIDPAGFGGETQMHDGTPTTVAELLKESTTGIVLFTYPKASTPGCKHSPPSTFRPSLTQCRYAAGVSLPQRARRPQETRARHLRTE